MMQLIRDKAQGIIAWIIVGMVGFVLCFWGIRGYFQSNASDVVAVVNGQEITGSEIDVHFNRWMRSYAANPDFDINSIDQNLLKQQLTRGLVEKQAFVGSLRRQGLVVSERVLLDTIKSDPHYQVDNKFSVERYREILSQYSISEHEFEEMQRNGLLMNQIQAAVVASNFVLPAQATQLIALRNQKRDFGYTIIQAKQYQGKVKVDSAQINKYYEENRDKFIKPEMVQLDYVELSIDDLKKKITVTDAELREYYKANAASFSEPELINVRHIMLKKSPQAAAQIKEIRARVLGGEDFAVVARAESEDEMSAEDGGDLGWVSRNDNLPDQVYALNKAGAVSEPLETDFGWHIFQLVNRQGGKQRSFADAKAVIAERFKREAAEKLFVAKGEELANLAFENPASLAAVTEQLKLPVKTTEFFAQAGGAGQGIAAAPNVVKAAFSDAVLKQQHNSELLRISDDSYVVVRVHARQEQHQQALDQVQAQIKETLVTQQAQDLAKQTATAIEQAIKAGKAPATVASAHNLKWQTYKDIERDNRNLKRYVLQRAFMLPKPQAPAVSSGAWQMPDGDYLVLNLTKVTAGKFTKKADSILEEMATKEINAIEVNEQMAAIHAALIAQSKIKYTEQE